MVARVLSNYSQAMADVKARSPGQGYVKEPTATSACVLILPVMLKSACNYSSCVLVGGEGARGRMVGGVCVLC